LTSILAPSGGFARYALNGAEDKTGDPDRRNQNSLPGHAEVPAGRVDEHQVKSASTRYRWFSRSDEVTEKPLSPAHWGL
jgi:hypothetical protein